MARRVVSLDMTRPTHKYVGPDGETRTSKPTVDSLLRLRKNKKKQKGRVVIRHKREL